jgi:probable HAF family extracellular repeat protein
MTLRRSTLRRVASLRLAALAGLLLACAHAQAQTPRYAVHDLGAFAPTAINESGQVAGTQGNRAVLYSGGQHKDITPPGAAIATANAINNSGQVAGNVFTCDTVNGNCVNGKTRGFIYSDGTFNVLGTFGGRDSFAYGINDAGLVVGYAYTAGPAPDIPGPEHAFIYRNGTLEDLNAPLGGGRTTAFAVNAPGDVIGFSGQPTGLFIYRNGSTTLLSISGFARAINDAGHIVGGLSGNDDGSGRAFVYRNGSVQTLGTLGSQFTYSTAFGVNNAGQLVGQSSFSWFTRQNERAVIFEGSTPTDLNTLIAPNSGWLLTSAADINDAGQIVGTGQLNGQTRAFLLTPASQPALLVEPGTTQAVALDSVTLMRAPFPFATARNFSADHRTRVSLFAFNAGLATGETAQAVSVRVEDAQHRAFVLPVEFVGPVPRFDGLTQIVVRLPDELATGGELQLTITLRGSTSSRATLSIRAPAAP